MSKFDWNRIKDGGEKLRTNKQTNRQDRHYENNGHLAVNQYKTWQVGALHYLNSLVNKRIYYLRQGGYVGIVDYGRPM